MFTLITILTKASVPYWNMYKRRLGEEGIAPLTIAHVPNLIGHPIGIALLFLTGLFLLPTDLLFYIYWVALVIIAAIVGIFTILGLLETKFFTTQVIHSLGFVSSSICAVIFLNEKLNGWTVFALILGVLGVIFFSYKKSENRFFVFDRGTIFTILAVVLAGFSSIFYKLASFHVPNTFAFFTGRFVVDLIVWTIIWIFGLWMVGKNPFKDFSSFSSFFKKPSSGEGTGFILLSSMALT